MGMRTPLSTVTGLGSAKDGTLHFWHQRLTALANVPLTLFLVWFVLRVGGLGRAEIIQVLGNPVIAGLLILTIFSITWHMRLGVQVVIEDYVHGEGRKILALVGNSFFCIGVAVLCIVAVLKLSFGG